MGMMPKSFSSTRAPPLTKLCVIVIMPGLPENAKIAAHIVSAHDILSSTDCEFFKYYFYKEKCHLLASACIPLCIPYHEQPESQHYHNAHCVNGHYNMYSQKLTLEYYNLSLTKYSPPVPLHYTTAPNHDKWTIRTYH